MSKRIKKEEIEVIYFKYSVIYNKKINNFTGIVVENSFIIYRKNGLLHRDNNEPAIIFDNTTKCFCKNGKTHREDGPAYITNGLREYWLHDRQVTKEQQEFYYDLLKLKNLV